MRTKKITLYYEITQKEVKNPSTKEIERKNAWIKAQQATVEAPHAPKYIKTTYEVFNPEIERQRRFFSGTCVLYYAIQNEDMFEGLPDAKMLDMYRETILDEMTGYDLMLVKKTVRRRKSTVHLKTVEAWSNFLNTLQETLFDPSGYEFPDSKIFWELAKQYGYEEAKRISVEKLQEIIKKKTISV